MNLFHQSALMFKVSLQVAESRDCTRTGRLLKKSWRAWKNENNVPFPLFFSKPTVLKLRVAAFHYQLWLVVKSSTGLHNDNKESFFTKTSTTGVLNNKQLVIFKAPLYQNDICFIISKKYNFNWPLVSKSDLQIRNQILVIVKWSDQKLWRLQLVKRARRR